MPSLRLKEKEKTEEEQKMENYLHQFSKTVEPQDDVLTEAKHIEETVVIMKQTKMDLENQKILDEIQQFPQMQSGWKSHEEQLEKDARVLFYKKNFLERSVAYGRTVERRLQKKYEDANLRQQNAVQPLTDAEHQVRDANRMIQIVQSKGEQAFDKYGLVDAQRADYLLGVAQTNHDNKKRKLQSLQFEATEAKSKWDLHKTAMEHKKEELKEVEQKFKDQVKVLTADVCLGILVKAMVERQKAMTQTDQVAIVITELGKGIDKRMEKKRELLHELKEGERIEEKEKKEKKEEQVDSEDEVD